MWSRRTCITSTSNAKVDVDHLNQTDDNYCQTFSNDFEKDIYVVSLDDEDGEYKPLSMIKTIFYLFWIS